jgi:hypothetical protein
MTSQFPNVADLVTDLKVALSFSTRLPLTQGSAVAGSDMARAVWALPIAGRVGPARWRTGLLRARGQPCYRRACA